MFKRFVLQDLFEKKTIKGVPKKEENLDIIVCKKQERNTFTELPDLKVTITKKLLYYYNTE